MTTERVAWRLGEAAELVGVTPKTLSRWVREGRAPRPHSVGRTLLFPADLLANWVATGCPDSRMVECADARGEVRA